MRSSVSIAALVLLCSGAVAHPPDAEFADWFRSLKEPGTEGTTGSSVSCCSPASDCQIMDYDTDAEGRYWITAEGERVQVPPDKILQRADNPTGRGVACLRMTTGIPSCAVLSGLPRAEKKLPPEKCPTTSKSVIPAVAKRRAGIAAFFSNPHKQPKRWIAC